MWSVQVTGILIVLNPAAWTASTIACVVSGFPQLVSVGSASNVFPRFHPGAMALTNCCGGSVSRGPPSCPPASRPPELDEPEEPDEPEELPAPEEELDEPEELPAPEEELDEPEELPAP